jgi:hypothetical protein
MIVRFNDVNEFIEEIQLDLAQIDRGIVQVTKAVSLTATPPLRHLAVVATARIGDTVVRLDHFCGELWEERATEGSHDAKIYARAEELMKRIEIAARSSSLEVRAGIVEPVGARS